MPVINCKMRLLFLIPGVLLNICFGTLNRKRLIFCYKILLCTQEFTRTTAKYATFTYISGVLRLDPEHKRKRFR